MATDFIEERSHKVLATAAIIDALEFTDDELAELTKYLIKRCGFEDHNPESAHWLDAYNIKVIADFVATLKKEEPSNPDSLYTLTPENDFAGLLNDEDKSPPEPFGGDGHDRCIEHLITDLDYSDDFP